MPITAWLIGGPQDGARITAGGGVLPLRVHVGPKWLGDGFAAWSRSPCQRFPAYYLYDGEANYIFMDWRVDPWPEETMKEPCKA